jgi:uncharacterized membrane protein YgcG
MTRAASLVAAAWLWSAATGLSAQAWEAGTDGLLPIPPLTARVTDLTQTLAPAETAALEAKLADWETRTSNQLVVLMVPSTQQEPIEAYSLRVAEKWRIGRKGQDNGALFLIAKNDRKMRIEVGYGLEGVLPDVTANRIIREDVAPAFRDGKFAAGINTGVDRIIAVVGGEKASPVTEVAAKARRGGFDIEQILFVLFFVVPVAGGIPARHVRTRRRIYDRRRIGRRARVASRRLDPVRDHRRDHWVHRDGADGNGRRHGTSRRRLDVDRWRVRRRQLGRRELGRERWRLFGRGRQLRRRRLVRELVMGN